MKCTKVNILFIDGNNFEAKEGEGLSDLHLVFKEPLVMVNFLNKESTRINYTYRLSSVAEVIHLG